MATMIFYLSDKEAKEIKKHAEAEGKTVSKFCREVLTNKTESGVILREPLEKEMIELRETVNERILDMVNICDRLSRGVVDKEQSQDKAIKEMRTHFERQCAILSERVTYQNKLTRELYKLMYEDVAHVKHYTKAIIEKGLDDINTAKACEKIAKEETATTIENLGID